MHIGMRRVRGSDREAAARIAVAAYRPSGLPPGHEYFDRLRAVTARDRAAEVWVALTRGSDGRYERVVGTVTWCPRGSALREIAGDDEAEFRMLAVSPQAQGQGIGGAMVRWCLARARDEGFARLVLSSADWMAAAHRIYLREGFGRLPERDWVPLPGIALHAYGRAV